MQNNGVCKWRTAHVAARTVRLVGGASGERFVV